MKYIYSAVFTPIKDGSGYYARVPDLPGCITTCASLSDAIDQITDAMAAWLCTAEDEDLLIPEPTPQARIQAAGGERSLIRADTIQYRAATDPRSVRKNVSLPAWMAAMADKRGHQLLPGPAGGPPPPLGRVNRIWQSSGPDICPGRCSVCQRTLQKELPKQGSSWYNCGREYENVCGGVKRWTNGEKTRGGM